MINEQGEKLRTDFENFTKKIELLGSINQPKVKLGEASDNSSYQFAS